MSEPVSGIEPIEYESLQDVKPGDIVAVQTRPVDRQSATGHSLTEPPAGELGNPAWYVFAGEVHITERWNGDIEPTALLVDDRHTSTDTRLASIHILPQVLWRISADGVTDQSKNVTQIPPVESSSTAPDDGPQPCRLRYCSDRRIRLIVFEAQANGSDICHFQRPLGTVVEVAHGAVIDPAQVLPRGYDPPK